MGEAVSSNFNNYVKYSSIAPWKLAVEPFRIAPKVYYVGNEWVGAFLVDTSEGLILIDTVVFENTYLTFESIRKLGFDPKNIRHIFLSHFHFDHSAGVEAIRQYSGAKVWLDEIDEAAHQNPAAAAMGGSGETAFKMLPYTVDCFYDHSKPMVFGDVTIQTIRTPGHTGGTTSFVITMPDENGKTIVAAMHGGVGPLTMTNAALAKFGWEPSVRKQFITDCDKLKEIHVDILIPSHPAHGNLFARRVEDPMDYHPFIDSTLWPKFLEERKQFVIDVDKKEDLA